MTLLPTSTRRFMNFRMEWVAYTKSGQKPDDIPAYSSGTYKDKGWVGFADWLLGED